MTARTPPPPDDPTRQKARIAREKGSSRQAWMTSSELAAYLNINPRTFRRWRTSGKIPAPAAKTTSGFGLWSPTQQIAALKEKTHT